MVPGVGWVSQIVVSGRIRSYLEQVLGPEPLNLLLIVPLGHFHEGTYDSTTQKSAIRRAYMSRRMIPWVLTSKPPAKQAA